MIKRLFTSFFIALLTLLLVPSAQAVDIPTLTWERGKEQNVVVGSISSQGLWQAKLLRPGSPQISLSPSSINSRGFSVFSATLPAVSCCFGCLFSCFDSLFGAVLAEN
jgi:hypothetical protein